MSSHVVHVTLLSKLFVGDLLSNSCLSKLSGRSSFVDANGVDENDDESDDAEDDGIVDDSNDESYIHIHRWSCGAGGWCLEVGG